MRNNEKKTRSAKPVGSMIFICAMMTTALGISLCLALIPVFRTGSIAAHAAWSYPAGLLLIVVGAYMAFRAVFVEHAVSNLDGESLITTGIFSWTRNPVHGGALLVSTGILIIPGNYFALLSRNGKNDLFYGSFFLLFFGDF